MSNYYTDDPIADFARKDADDQEWLDSRPRCIYCDEPIQTDYCYEIEGELCCEGCLNEHHKKMTDDFVEGGVE
jgi:hypothetical protein